MDLHSHHPYWLMKSGIVKPYVSLQENIQVDVAIMGGGISGALIAYYLANEDTSSCVIDRRHIGMGSTAASTALLQYEIDTPIRKLKEYVGLYNAIKSYELCRKAIYDIQNICGRLNKSASFSLRPSLHYASFKSHLKGLYEEYSLRKTYGFDVKWMESDELQDKFALTAPGAIFSGDGAEVDAYLLTHYLLSHYQAKGHAVYDNTDVIKISYNKRGVELETADGYKINAKKLVIACGYESLKYIPKKVAELHSTYALVTEPLRQHKLWYKNSLVWETANPYLYFRAVDGNRILIGGKDDKFYNPDVRDARIKRKSKALIDSFQKKMKGIPAKADFSWAGTFAVTKDGLPYIGSIPGMPHTYFALGFGGNGITFSVIAAEMIRDLVRKGNSPNSDLFSFNR